MSVLQAFVRNSIIAFKNKKCLDENVSLLSSVWGCLIGA